MNRYEMLGRERKAYELAHVARENGVRAEQIEAAADTREFWQLLVEHINAKPRQQQMRFPSYETQLAAIQRLKEMESGDNKSAAYARNADRARSAEVDVPVSQGQ